MTGSAVLVIGASGSLGRAMCNRWQQDEDIGHVFAVSRQLTVTLGQSHDDPIDRIHCDYSEASITEACEKIKTLMDEKKLVSISRVCICNGILHNENVWPEKRLEDVDISAIQEVFTINSIVPLLWLKALLSLVKAPSDCVITVFNARIGSIGDNRSGGWYSYRASKAALNMLLKTAAIEYARRAKNVKLISFHPGTTDTALSKPFQASVKKEDLFTADFVAGHLVKIMNNQTVDGSLSFIDWENKSIAW
jgi:NAD(P)-dependent dehydrogenase (short-subunit alcohol dehydrogenase family)